MSSELIVDNFAGGGGASTGIKQALGRAVDIAINHDPEALAVHKANHPGAHHYCESVWDVDPVVASAGRPVGLAWFSPDCKHFSKAKGGKPVDKNIRGLAWITVRWAATVRPRIIILENVEEFLTWGPLTADYRPDPLRRSFTFRRWVGELEKLGYRVEWRVLRACDYGAPTIRKRLFLVARCDGLPITWPTPTHGPGYTPWRTAAECIDWTIPCPSIFARKKPLAENTLRRIARGIQRYVIETAEPFIINTRNGERAGQAPRIRDINAPLYTVTAQGSQGALVTAFIAKYYGEQFSGRTATDVREPTPTITARATQINLVSSYLIKLKGTCRDGQLVTAPMPTVQAEGTHIGEVHAFLVKYYGTARDGVSLRASMHTLPTKDHMGLVTVHGVNYQIADIGMRMLTPRELYRAQGFPESYIIAPEWNGKPLTKTAQIRLCGNSVCPPIAAALVRANYAPQEVAAAQKCRVECAP